MSPIVRAAVLALACLCALFAFWVRAENAIGVRYTIPVDRAHSPPQADRLTWGSYDPDTLYHARRVARATQNDGWVASDDLRLGHPHPAGSLGAPIPWPPAYDLFLTALARRALPDFSALFVQDAGTTSTPPLDLDERDRIERLVSVVPLVCGTLAAFFAALWAARLAYSLAREDRRDLAALCAATVAGLTLATTFGHARYSHIGNGDHHAFVSLLHLLLLGLVSSALTRERVVQPIRNALRGGLAGVIAGVLIATWTASILWVALVQFALLLRLVLPFPNTIDADAPGGAAARARAQGLPLFATSFHKTALLVVIPAMVASPFTTTTPFSIVNLSWFHPVWLAAGWLVFAPYAIAPRMATGRPFVMALPALFVALVVLLATNAPAQLAEAFSWAGADNVFMGSINESQPLVGAGGSFAKLLKFVGIGVVLAPLVWIDAVRRTVRSPQLLPWVTVLPVVLAMACLQRRFAEVAAGPLAVVLGAIVALWVVDLVARRGALGRGVGIGVAVALGVLALAANPWTLRNTWTRMELRRASGDRFVTSTDIARRQRVLAEVLNGLAPLGGAPESSSAILAEWDLGHAIEWRAQRPSIATNFGLYIGEDSFLTPWRFFAETDDQRAESLLLENGISTVLIDRTTPARRPTIAAALGEPAITGPAWPESMASRMLGTGSARDANGPAPGANAAAPPANGVSVPGFLQLTRLVADPMGGTVRVFEVVAGARLRVVARSFSVVVTLAGQDGASTVWRASARAATEGPGGEPEVLVVRCPYGSPESETGTGHTPRGAVRVIALDVFVDGVATPLEFPREAVDEGLWVDLPR